MSASHQLILLLRRAVCGGELPDEPLQWEELVRLSALHKVESILYYAVKDVEEMPDEAKRALQKAWVCDIARDTRQEYTANRIRASLQAAGVIFAPMKGLLLKYDYPLPHLRYMSDIDFYIRTGDRAKIKQCLMELGATRENDDCGDIAYDLPGGVHAEFHGRLLYRAGTGGVLGYPDWKQVVQEKNRLTEDGYALNLIGHLAYNLSRSGLGVRYILDLWIYRHRHEPQPDWEKVMTQLKQDGLDQVAQLLIDLSEYWLGDGRATPVLEELEQYILESGLYGFSERGALSEASFNRGKAGAVWRQVFRSREEFQNRYPWLRECPFLLPAAWVMRAVKSLTSHRTFIEQWVRQLRQTPKAEIKAQKERLKRFGFSGNAPAPLQNSRAENLQTK